MEHKILDIITHYLTENRIKEIMNQDENYRTAKQYEDEAYEKLEKSLSPEQSVLLNDYIAAEIDTKAVVEQLHYSQGMKDLFTFFRELS